MKFNITESITADVSIKELEKMIMESAAKDGYDVVSITPQYKYARSHSNSKSYTQSDMFSSTTGTSREFSGFKVDLKRRKGNEPQF